MMSTLLWLSFLASDTNFFVIKCTNLNLIFYNRLISERTVEENILKKAQQKRLLGDVAIEEGNFTTAFFKQNAISELFGEELKGGGDLRDLMDSSAPISDARAAATTTAQSSATSRNDLSIDSPPGEDTNLQARWEEALEDVEEKTDIAAAKTARAEAAAEFAEFDETIPLEQEGMRDEDRTAAEEELDRVIEELSPVEKYALMFLEATQDPAQMEQLKQADVSWNFICNLVF